MNNAWPGVHRPCHSKTLHAIASPILLASIPHRGDEDGMGCSDGACRHAAATDAATATAAPSSYLNDCTAQLASPQQQVGWILAATAVTASWRLMRIRPQLCTCARQPHCALLALRPHARMPAVPPPLSVTTHRHWCAPGPCTHRMCLGCVTHAAMVHGIWNKAGR